MIRHLDPHVFGEDQRCFGCGPHNEQGMQLRFRVEQEEVVTEFLARPGWEGPPGIVHGGLQATLADEIGAWTLVGLRGRFGFTASAQLKWLRPARMDVAIEARGRLLEETDGGATVQVGLRQVGRLVLTGTLRYVYATVPQAERMLGMPLPEAWRRLAKPDPA